MTKAEKKIACANVSLEHVDFMIGTNDTNILGVKANGEEIQIFKDGNWA